jgi:hypothetical protein
MSHTRLRVPWRPEGAMALPPGDGYEGLEGSPRAPLRLKNFK